MSEFYLTNSLIDFLIIFLYIQVLMKWKGGLIWDQTYILNVVLEVLGITERGLQWLDREILTPLVGETHHEPHDLIGKEL